MKVYLGLLIALLLPSFAQAQWTQCNGPYGGNVDFIAQNKITQTLFAGTIATGLYRQKNGAGTWESLQSKFQTPEIDGIVAVDSVIYVSNSIYGLYKSVDDGDTWTSVYVSHLASSVISMMRTDGSSIILSANDSMYISQAGGAFVPFGYSFADRDMIINSGRLIEASFESPDNYVYMAYSDDKGQNWQTVFVDSGFYPYQTHSTISIQQYSNNYYVYLDGKLRYFSSDSGLSWDSTSCNNLPFCNMPLNQVQASSKGLLLAGPQGVSVFSGGKWSSLNNGLYVTHVNFICRYLNEIFICFGNSSLYSSGNEGVTWSPVGVNGIPNYYPLHIVGMTNYNNRLILATNYLGTAYSDNGGLTWTDSSDNGGLTQLSVAGKRIYAIFSGGIVYSDDGGLDWYWASQQGLSFDGLFCVYNLLATNSEEVIATEFCNGAASQNIFVNTLAYSPDSSNNFNLGNFSDNYIQNIAVLGSKAFAIGSFLAKSADKGADWYLDSSLHQSSYSAIYTIEPKFVLLASGSGHIFFSSDTGNTFTDITANFTASVAQFYFLDKMIYAISPYQGIWKIDATNLGIPGDFIFDTAAAEKSGVYIFPDPASDFIHIILTNNRTISSTSVIEIYNNLGQLVFTEQEPAAGTYTIAVDKFPKGVYFLKIVGDGNNKGTKFVID